MSPERTVKSISIFKGRVVDLRVETIEMSSGATIERELIYHGGAVAVVPLDEDGNVILVRQYRAGAKKELLELPAGGIESGEDPTDCARRELQEEIGYFPGELEEIGRFFVAASYTTEEIVLYIGRDLQASTLEGDVDEDIQIEKMPFQDALALAMSNQIDDSKTLIGLMWAAKRLGKLVQGRA